MVTGIPILVIAAGMVKRPRILSSHARAHTPAHTARHFAAYRLASASFARMAVHSASALNGSAFVFLFLVKFISRLPHLFYLASDCILIYSITGENEVGIAKYAVKEAIYAVGWLAEAWMIIR